MPRQEAQRDVGRPLADHEVDGDEALEDDGPCRVAQAVLQRAEDLGDARLARVRGDEDVLDVLGLRGGSLECWLAGRVRPRPVAAAHLDLRRALDGLLEGARHGAGSWG